MWKVVITKVKQEETGYNDGVKSFNTNYFSGMTTYYKYEVVDFLETRSFSYSENYYEIVIIYYKSNFIFSFNSCSGIQVLQSAIKKVEDTNESKYVDIN